MAVIRRLAPSTVCSDEITTLEELLIEEASKKKVSDHNSSSCSSSLRQIYQFLKGMGQLFAPRLRKTTCLLMAIILPINFGYFGFMMWFPEYLKHQGSNTTYLDDETSYTHPPSNDSSGYVYKESIFVALGCLPGNLLAIFITDKIGPKLLLCLSQLLTAGSVFLLYWFKSASQTILISCLFNAVSAPVFVTIDTFIPLLYPPEYRTTGFGLHSSLMRVAMITSSWVFSLFIDRSPTVPILLTACLLLSSTFFSIFIPKIPSSSSHSSSTPDSTPPSSDP